MGATRGADEREPTLDDLGRKYDTDKASTWASEGKQRPGHDYLRHYESVLARYRERPVTLLDLGVGPPPREFASARMWRDYFPGSRIVAVDVREPEAETPAGIEFVRGDLGHVTFLVELVRAYRPDIVVEDASHKWPHQLLSLFYLLPAVVPGGTYIWEDLYVSHPTMAEHYAAGLTETPVDFLGLLAREVVLDRWARIPPPDGASAPEAGVTELMLTSLAPLVDRVTIVGKAALLRRRHSS